MRTNYDFSTSRKNPHAAALKQPVTIRLDRDTVRYFKSMAKDTGMPYQSIINLYLRDCAATQRRLRMTWPARTRSGH